MSQPPQGGAGVRTAVTCSKCGKATTVPFAPTPGRPVFCRECFAGSAGTRPPERAGPARGPSYAPPHAPGHTSIPRKRMMAQGRKGHFMHDARALLTTTEGGMEDKDVRAFLEGLFARGARGSTEGAQIFLDEKLADKTITAQQRQGLCNLVERYSFWR